MILFCFFLYYQLNHVSAGVMKSDFSIADFSPGLFWDVRSGDLNLREHKRYVIGRVLERGTLEDWTLIRRRWALETIVDVAQSLRSLDIKSVAFLCAIAHVSRDSFRCYTKKSLPQSPWTC